MGNNRQPEKKVKPSFGIVNPWPGDMSAESEVLARIKRASDDVGIECVMLSNFGHVLDSNQKQTDEIVDPKILDFVITTHYDSPKTIDSFYYHTLWNPPEIPLNLPDYDSRVTDNYIMNDDYLIYDAGGMSNHLRCMLMNRPRNIDEASMLVASFPESAMLEPDLKDPKMFYCGMNWERVVHNTNRHEGLFKKLDATGSVKFFGPDKNPAWGGIAPWEGYDSYQYPIPFDGFSILKEINECGVVLVLSSDIHRKAGAATNRTYEACAGGAVIISDDNPFMEKYFKDAALFIKYNKLDPEDTYKQIMDKYDWIKANPKDALKLAQRAQEIFREKFSLDKQLTGIFENHEDRVQAVAGDLYALHNEGKVLVTTVLNTLKVSEAKEQLNSIISNIEKQSYSNIVLAVACDQSIYDALYRCYSDSKLTLSIVPMSIYDIKGSKFMTDGQVIREMSKTFEHAYFVNAFSNEIWYQDHITTLVRLLQDKPESGCAYSGRMHEDIYGFRRRDMFGLIEPGVLIEGRSMPCAGQIMLTYEAEYLLPDYFFDFMDGFEHYAYLLMLKQRFDMTPEFTRRMTLVYTNNQPEKQYFGLKTDYQIRVIRDAIKYNMPVNPVVYNQISKNFAGHPVEAFPLVDFPVKQWLKMKYVKFRMHRARIGSKSHEKWNKKFQAEHKKLDEMWRAICT